MPFILSKVIKRCQEPYFD